MAEKVKNVDQVKTDVGQFLKEVGAGSCSFDLAKGIENVIRGVRDTSKKGKLDLKLTFEPFKGDPNRIVVGYNVVEGAPKAGKPVSMFFSTMNNTLQRKDPNQMEFSSEAGFEE